MPPREKKKKRERISAGDQHTTAGSATANQAWRRKGTSESKTSSFGAPSKTDKSCQEMVPFVKSGFVPKLQATYVNDRVHNLFDASPTEMTPNEVMVILNNEEYKSSLATTALESHKADNSVKELLDIVHSEHQYILAPQLRRLMFFVQHCYNKTPDQVNQFFGAVANKHFVLEKDMDMFKALVPWTSPRLGITYIFPNLQLKYTRVLPPFVPPETETSEDCSKSASEGND
eukprot:GHVP01056622.1.p1 GENE.GHVP01056622.1~~GHVP01056622.1.p1  ORF type:complete len:231 (+),score=32.44 GHVP01056622.1:2-694(+)